MSNKSKKIVSRGNKTLGGQSLQNIVNNIDDLSDLSDCDEEDHALYGGNVSSPSDSFIHLSEAQLVERRLEEIFGFCVEDEVNDEFQETATTREIQELLENSPPPKRQYNPSTFNYENEPNRLRQGPSLPPTDSCCSSRPLSDEDSLTSVPQRDPFTLSSYVEQSNLHLPDEDVFKDPKANRSRSATPLCSFVQHNSRPLSDNDSLTSAPQRDPVTLSSFIERSNLHLPDEDPLTLANRSRSATPLCSFVQHSSRPLPDEDSLTSAPQRDPVTLSSFIERSNLHLPDENSLTSTRRRRTITRLPLRNDDSLTSAPQSVTLSSYVEQSNLPVTLPDEDPQTSATQRHTGRNRSVPREWKNVRETHYIPSFDKMAEPRSNYTHKTQPMDVFEKFFPDSVVEIIVAQTNRYALQKNCHSWSDTSTEEIKAYLGVLIMMGLNPLPDMELYWSSDPFYNNAEISRVFPLTRFKKIIQNFHLNDNEMESPRGSPGHDKLYKLRPLITLLNEVFKNEMNNSNTQSIDECMVKFKGRCSLKQYMPKKPVKRGFKIWARCDSKTGYMYQFQIYTGKGDSVENEGLGYNVVMALCAEVPRNTLLAFDNFFTSCNLMDDLYQKGIYAVGTVRSDRKDLPGIMKKSQPRSLRLAKNQFATMTAEPITAIKWHDTRDVCVLTTAHKPLDTVFVKRTQKDGTRQDILCPKAIASYTLTMGGVDHFDHFRSSYPIDRKSRKYWMRLFIFMFDSAIINAYITYNTTHTVTNHSHRNFRLKLARGLVDNYTTKKNRPTIYKNKKGGCFGVPPEIRLLSVGVHMPEETEPRRCRFCSTKKVQKRTRICCTVCKVPLCAKSCFKLFHSVESVEE